MRDKIKLSKEDGKALVFDDAVGDFEMEQFEYEITGTSRWETQKVALVKNKLTGDMYLLHYSVGSTECQETEWFEYDDPILYPAKSVTIQKWVVDDNK